MGRRALLVAASLTAALWTAAPAGAVVTFSGPHLLGAQPGAANVAVGDLNGDRKPDIATANFNTGGTNGVSVLFNTTPSGASTPTFTPSAQFTAGQNPNGIAIGDLNRDGRPDLAVANQASSGGPGLSVLFNATVAGGAPAFTGPTNFTIGPRPAGVVITEVFDDGLPDIVTANEGSPGTSDGFTVLINTTPAGAAAPTFGPMSGLGSGPNPTDVAAFDYDGDGDRDLAAPSSTSPGPDGLVVLDHIPGGFGGFPFATGPRPRDLAVADFNGDAKPDVATANFSSTGAARTSVLLNTTTTQGTPTFAPHEDFDVSSSIWEVAAGDLNGDSRPDLVTTDLVDSARVLLNVTPMGNPFVGFGAPSPYPSGTNPNGVALADFNGDSKLDVVTANYSTPGPNDDLAVLLNTSRPALTVSQDSLTFADQRVGTIGPFQRLFVFNTGGYPLHVTSAELVGADRDDFVVANDDCSGETIPDGGACAVSVRFFPTAAGPRAATLRIVSDAPGSPHGVTLSGTGGSAVVGPAGPAGSDGGDGPAGPAGTPGTKGPGGATGTQGERGPAGRDAQVTCALYPTRSKSKAVVQCTVTLATPKTGSARVRVVRAGRTYASGDAVVRKGSLRVRLRPSRGMRPGRYVVTVKVGSLVLKRTLTVR